MGDQTSLPPPPSLPPVPGTEPWRQVRTRSPSTVSPIGALFLLVGSGLLLIGLALPRLTFVIEPYVIVYRGSFIVTTLLAVVGLVELVCAVGMTRGASGPLASVLALIIVASVVQQLFAMTRIADIAQIGGTEASVGPGAYLIGVAAAVIAVGGLLGWPRR